MYVSVEFSLICSPMEGGGGEVPLQYFLMNPFYYKLTKSRLLYLYMFFRLSEMEKPGQERVVCQYNENCKKAPRVTCRHTYFDEVVEVKN